MRQNETTTIVQMISDFSTALRSTPPENIPSVTSDFFDQLQSFAIFSDELLKANKQALLTEDWRPLAKAISEASFGEHQDFFVMAPFQVWRPGTTPQISALFCSLAEVRPFPCDEQLLLDEYGDMTYVPILPVNIHYSDGNIGGEHGETFIVPSGWHTMPEIAATSPLMDIQGSQEKIEKLAHDGFLTSLFNSAAARELIEFRNDSARIMQGRLWEYTAHEYGHAQGHFAERIADMKGNMKLAAFEEWRADGVMVDIIDRHVQEGIISEEEGRDVLMSNFMTRFGTDIARNDAKIDHDFLTSYWIMLSLQETGNLAVKNQKIILKGDVNAYAFWRDLYSHLRRDALAASAELFNIEFDPLLEAVPQSNYSLEDFTQLIAASLSKGQNGTARPNSLKPH